MEKTKKQSLALALVLSLLVGIAGSVVWGLLYSLGWFASIVAYATSFGMFAVYLKFSKLSKLTFVWTLVWVILLNIIASFVAIVISVSVEAQVSISESLDAVFQNFGLIASDFVIDIVLGTVFCVLGVVSYYAVYKRQQKEKAILEQLNQQANAQNASKDELTQNDNATKVETKIEDIKIDDTKEDLKVVEGEIVENLDNQNNN